MEGVLEDPAPTAYLTGLGSSSIDFDVMFWINQKESSYLEVQHNAIKAIKNALDERGIDIPYPYQVVQFDNSLHLKRAREKVESSN